MTSNVETPRRSVIQTLSVISTDPRSVERVGTAMNELAASLWQDADASVASLSINYNIDYIDIEDEEIE